MSEEDATLVQIENDDLSVTISTLGAELQRIYSKKYAFDYLWNDNKRGYWKRHAPILFPFIGRSNQDQYLVNGATYPMSQHGFIRDHVFSVVEKGSDYAVLKFAATTETKKIYPFAFSFSVRYTLSGSGLQETFTVANDDDKPLSFSLGSHPGFNVENDLAQYQLMVTKTDTNTPLKQFEIGPVPFRDGKVVPFAAATANNEIDLSHQLLDDGLIILANQDIQQIKLQSTSTKRRVTLSLADFPYIALWSPEKKNAPFVCIEPFAGLPDEYGQPGDIFKKLGNNTLAAGKNQQFSYQLTFE
ncbi:aldose 1-epimerase family protein [Loigolactobacillus binensis]|uniref:Aldose 1-epimerase family protein n=1 Tax=Loigolactobacillus binensis TaxID=2559922 RepID=A0ABW3EI66_9LACO|nr:aldose 1-epimerase family protein [Loigolactobacillus binensis]